MLSNTDRLYNQALVPDIVRYSYEPYKMNIALDYFKRFGENILGKTFEIDGENEFVIKNLIRWAHGDNEFQAIDPKHRKVVYGDITKGIYIAGGTGTGKSLLMSILSNYLTVDKVVFLSRKTNIKQLAFPYYTTNRVCAYYRDNGDLSPFIDPAVICFHDLGVEQQETLFMGTRAKVLQTILQERGDRRGQITLITSNYDMIGEEITNLYGDRITSRLMAMCNYYELDGKDRRQ